MLKKSHISLKIMGKDFGIFIHSVPSTGRKNHTNTAYSGDFFTFEMDLHMGFKKS